MSGVVSVCPVHGVFESKGFDFGNNAVNVTVIGGKEDCPQCGRPAKVMEGSFTFKDGIVQVLSSPQWTIDALLQARQALQDLDLGRVRTHDEAIRKLEGLSPLAAELVKKSKAQSWTREQKLQLLSILIPALIAILTSLLSAGVAISIAEQAKTPAPPAGPTSGQIEQIVHEVISEFERTGEPPTRDNQDD